MRYSEFNSNIKSFIATVKVNGSSIKTLIAADSAAHARLLAQSLYGSSNLVSLSESGDDLEEQASGTKTLTPDQLKIKSLSDKKAQISDQIKQERERQKLAKAQMSMQKALQARLKN
jgi:hypothetical protein